MSQKSQGSSEGIEPDRRDLTSGKTAAAGAAAALLSAASYARVVGANERIRTGHIGLGGRGEALLALVTGSCKDVDAIALCDVYRPHREGMSKYVKPDVKLEGDYRKLLESKDIDAVVIATPDHWHAKIFVDACRAGKDVYVEKPLSLTVAEGRRMVEVAKETSAITQMGVQRHSSPYIIRACKMIRDGEIGKVTRVRCFHLANEAPAGIGRLASKPPPEGLDWDFWLGPAAKRDFCEIMWNFKFRWFWDFSGGFMTDTGVHWLDVIQTALNQEAPKWVSAVGGKYAVEDDREIPDTMEAIWQFKDCLVTFEQMSANAAHATTSNPQIEFRGTNGTLCIFSDHLEVVPEEIQDSPYPMRGPLARDQEMKKKRVIEPFKGNGSPDQAAHLQNFFSSVKSRKETNCPALWGHRCTTTALIANIALREKALLEWDSVVERFTNNDRANERLKYHYREPWKL